MKKENMEISKSAQEKIRKIQIYEQKIQALTLQKQEIDTHVHEIESAIQAINETKEKESYKIIGNVMVLNDNSKILEELNLNKKKFEMRIRSIEKQENELKEMTETIQKQALKEIEEKK